MDAVNDGPHLIHLGAYGTGTNYLCRTLERSGLVISNSERPNSWNQHNKVVFKHYVIEADTLRVLKPPSSAIYLCIIKNPFFWIQSLKRMAHAGILTAREMKALGDVDVEDFIRSGGTMVGARREVGDDEEARVRYDNLPDLWNRYVRGYLQYLPQEQTLILRYEDILMQPGKYLSLVMEKASASGREIKLYEGRRFQTETEPGVGHNHAEALEYYSDAGRRYHEFSDRSIAFMQNNLDSRLMIQFGYA